MNDTATIQSPSETLYERSLIAILATRYAKYLASKTAYNRKVSPEYKRLASKKWAASHRDIVALRHKQWSARPESKLKIAAAKAKTYQKHKVKIKAAAYAWYCAKCKSDPVFRMVKSFRTRIQKRVKKPNRLPMWDLLGCDSPAFRSHIASQFAAGMTWDNYGRGDGKWVIDHVRPIANFDMRNVADQKACWHYSNMQPLWWSDNARKHANV